MTSAALVLSAQEPGYGGRMCPAKVGIATPTGAFQLQKQPLLWRGTCGEHPKMVGHPGVQK